MRDTAKSSVEVRPALRPMGPYSPYHPAQEIAQYIYSRSIFGFVPLILCSCIALLPSSQFPLVFRLAFLALALFSVMEAVFGLFVANAFRHYRKWAYGFARSELAMSGRDPQAKSLLKILDSPQFSAEFDATAEIPRGNKK